MVINETNIHKKERRICKIIHSSEELNIIHGIADDLGLSEITAGLIYDRGARDILSAREFISDGYDCFYDPFLLKDMDRAVSRILTAILNKEKIVVYGDYDVDGVTSVCTLVTYLKRRGALDSTFYIPSREGEGYGLNVASIDRLKSDGCTLMITVDTGITALDEIKHACEMGLDTVVTDHHECIEDETGENIIPCVPCVNPRQKKCAYPFDELAGVGVVFKLLTALEMKLTQKSVACATEDILDEFGELVSLGTVADVMPLYGENRAIVKRGLELLRDPKFVGMRELISLAAGYDFSKKNNKRISTSLISFTLAPRINAVGRMGNASDAAMLFMTDDPTVAGARAYELCEMNVLRQKEENSILNEALEKIKQCEHAGNVIVLDDDKWHHGVIGIVASRITEKYAVPCILISFDGHTGNGGDDIGKGSGRSVKGIDLVKALGECKEELVKFGGHELAAGLTIERKNLDSFRKKLDAYVSDNLLNASTVVDIVADAELSLPELNETLINELYLLEPYGQANPVPQFLVSDLTITGKYSLKDGKHIKLVLTDGENSVTALYFGMNYNEFEFDIGDRIDILGTAELNEFMGKKSVQIHIKEVRASDNVAQMLARDSEIYNDALHGGAFPADMLPNRDDFADVYRYLRNNINGDTEFSFVRMCSHLRPGSVFPYIKLRAVLDILNEMALIVYKFTDIDRCTVSLVKTSTKVDLMTSSLLSVFKSKSQVF